MPEIMLGIVIVAVILLLVIFFPLCPIGLWNQGSGIRRPSDHYHPDRHAAAPHLSPRLVDAMITATKAGLDLTINQLEKHYLAAGNIERGGQGADLRQQAGIKLTFEQTCAIDLAGRDVLQAVQMSVIPKVIETPAVAAIAKDGIELRAKARVTVRTSIQQLVGGAGEETVMARVGEGIVTTIGSAGTHKEVLENPDKISHTVLNKGLDAGTAFEILSIDIADVDVGRNIAPAADGPAEADRRIAQARAEERRAMAVPVSRR